MEFSNVLKNETVAAFSEKDVVQVLALDGGGLKGVFTASVINKLEKQLGHSITEHFDIITGTSTGGLIALGLGAGLSGKEIEDFYIKHGPEIFPSKGLLGNITRWFCWWFKHKYSGTVLEKKLKDLFKHQGELQPLLGDSHKRLIVPTFLASESTPRLLKTPHASRYKYDWRLPMWVVGMATAAAPTYFPVFKYDNKHYLDGGLWANNPALIGLVEALDLGADIKNIRVLNIGTTFSHKDKISFYPLSKLISFLKLKRSGLLSWAKTILPTSMHANSFATAHMYTHQLLAPGNSFVINKQLDDGEAALDRVDIDKFLEMGAAAGELYFPQLGNLFKHKAAIYTPDKEAMRNGLN